MSINMHEQEKTLFDAIKERFFVDNNPIFVGTLLKITSEQFPNRIALITSEKSITYKEFYFRSLLLSKTLSLRGVRPRDRVILFYENSIEFYIAYFAVWQLGAVVVPVNTFLHEKELAYIVSDATPQLIISSLALKSKLDQLATSQLLDALPEIITEEEIDWTTPEPQSLQKQVAINENLLYNLEPDELCTLLYTSGTTGTPKGVMLSSRNIMTNTMQGHARFALCGLSDQERFFCVLPLFHVFAQNACLWLPIMTGSTVIIIPKIDRKFILEGLAHKPTLFLGFPALYGLLCLIKTAPLDSIKIFVSGADMLPDKIRAGFALIYGRKICSGYGLSEAAPIVSVNHENNTQATNVVGNPVVNLLCEIRDEEHNVVPQGIVGALWIKGDNIMMGYYKDHAATNAILIDGWLNTGDLASVDVNGNLAICGRSKDIIIHKGFNIYPAEVENILMKHPTVFKAAVLGQEEAASGQVPIAFVAVKKHDVELESTLRELCSHNLAKYKVPRRFVCLDDLPMNATGKVDKKQLQKTLRLQ